MLKRNPHLLSVSFILTAESSKKTKQNKNQETMEPKRQWNDHLHIRKNNPQHKILYSREKKPLTINMN